jgi:hypothetical protein
MAEQRLLRADAIEEVHYGVTNGVVGVLRIVVGTAAQILSGCFCESLQVRNASR